jgi:elongator complex protein 3
VAKNPARAARPKFDPRAYAAQLIPLLREIAALPRPDAAALQQVLRKEPKDGRGFFSRSDLIAGFRHFRADTDFGIDEKDLLQRLKRKPVRTQSGVTPVTVLTKPFPCPGQCIFCPSDVRMPKSYLRDEPGAQRATLNKFDPFLQVWNRLSAFYQLGHPVDKVELIVLGGTWSSYPETYQRWFILRCFDALNEFGTTASEGAGERWATVEEGMDFLDLDEAVDGSGSSRSYNEVVKDHLKRGLKGSLLAGIEEATWEALCAAQVKNESSACRSVGLVLETRPDCMDEVEVKRLRRLGATKVQLGIQTLSDEILAKNKRGHDSEATRQAVGLLRRAGFKIHAHWMPNLFGATPEGDRQDFQRLFGEAAFRPDELKIYPCSLIETSELMQVYEAGQWQPYGHEELVDLLADCLANTPEYCRLTRVVRDIPSTDIVEGNKVTNLREVAEKELQNRGQRCRDIRSREIRAASFDVSTLERRALEVETEVSREMFLQWVTPDDQLVGFLRLCLPFAASFIEELGNSALIREVHVYGVSAELGERDAGKAQHLGLGQLLLEWAAQLAKQAGYSDIAVISAIGTRGYYRKVGFQDGVLYQHRSL